MTTLARVAKYRKCLPIQLPRAFQFTTSLVMPGECPQSDRQIGVVRRQHAASNVEGLRQESPFSIQIRRRHERRDG